MGVMLVALNHVFLFDSAVADSQAPRLVEIWSCVTLGSNAQESRLDVARSFGETRLGGRTKV